MSGDRPLRMALVQHAPRLGDLAANVEWTSETLRAEVERGEDLVVFPELSLCGYLLKDLVPETAIRLDGPDLSGGSTRHYLAFTPYWERAFLRSDTPAASSVPRITL